MHPKNLDILKQFRTHFEAKHEKGVDAFPPHYTPVGQARVCRPNVYALNLSIKFES